MASSVKLKFENETSNNRGVVDWSDPEMREKILEGRRTALPRRAYEQAIANHCRECWPYQEDCKGKDCHLYLFRNNRVRRGKKKPETRRAIKHECTECLGTTRDICQSPSCALYPVRFGKNHDE